MAVITNMLSLNLHSSASRWLNDLMNNSYKVMIFSQELVSFCQTNTLLEPHFGYFFR